MATTVFSHVRSRAGLHFVSGQTPLSPDGEVPDSATGQTHIVLDKIEALLADVGSGLADVMKVTYFLTRIEDLAEVRAVLLDRLPDPPPAASLVEVSNLIDPRFRVEIEAIAVTEA